MNMKKTENALKQIIDREGINYLSTDSFAVYNELLEKKTATPQTARLILITLLAGVTHEQIRNISDISAYIQKECCLKKSAADKLADIYCSLFNENNCREWENKSEEGYREFCSQELNYELDTHAVWAADFVEVEADCHVKVDMIVNNPQTLHKSIGHLLTKNPFITAKSISEFFVQKLQKQLDDDFDDYVTCDPYYPPVAEDYEDNFEDLITRFCDKYGFQLIS